MDHSAMDMAATTVASAAMPASTSSMSGGHGGGGHSMGGNSCKISMLWNWHTVDSCFISRSWHNTSKGMFAGSCIGVIFLVMALEFLRRAGKEYDRYIIAEHQKSLEASGFGSRASSESSNTKILPGGDTPASAPTLRFRPTVVQQLVRALLHMMQFAVAYIVMLLAMYYNGYIIICIFIGAFLGYAVFGWESFNIQMGGRDRMQANATVCCG